MLESFVKRALPSLASSRAPRLSERRRRGGMARGEAPFFMTSAQQRRTLRVAAIVLVAAIVCDGTSTMTEALVSSQITEVAYSTNKGEDTSLAATSILDTTPGTSSSAAKPLDMTTTAFTYDHSLSSDEIATGKSSETTEIASGSTMTSSSTLSTTTMSAVNLAESVNSSAENSLTSLGGGVSTTVSEDSSSATSATVEVYTTTFDGSSFLTTSLAATSILDTTPGTFSSAAKPLDMITTAFTYEYSLSSDEIATAKSSETTEIASGSTMTSSSTLPTSSMSAVNLVGSVNSSAESLSTTLGAGASTIVSEDSSSTTSATSEVNTTTFDGSSFLTTSSSNAATTETVQSTVTSVTATTGNSTFNAESAADETSVDKWPSTSSIVPPDAFTSQSTITSMFLTSAFTRVMNTSVDVIEAASKMPIYGGSTVLSNQTSISQDSSSSEASSTTQIENILSHSRTAEAEATLTTAMYELPNVSSTVLLHVNEAAFTNGTASTDSNESSTLAVESLPSETVTRSEIIATTPDAALSNESSYTATDSRTTSLMTSANQAFDDATLTAFTLAVRITSTETVKTASGSQSSASDRAANDEVMVTRNDTASTQFQMDNSTLQSSSPTTYTSAFPYATLSSSSSFAGHSSSDVSTIAVSNSTTSEALTQPETGYDITLSAREATSAMPDFATKTVTTPKDTSADATQISSTTMSSWNSNVSSTDSLIASHFYSSVSSALPSSESNTSSSHAGASWSTADALHTSASTELPAALPGSTFVSTSVSTVHSTSLTSLVFNIVTAPEDLSTITTSTLRALDQTTAENATAAQSMPLVSLSQVLSGSATTSLLSSASPSPTSLPSMSADAANSSEAALLSPTTTDWIGSRLSTFSKASAPESEPGVTDVIASDASSASAPSSSSFAAPQSTKTESDQRQSTANVTENLQTNFTSTSVSSAVTTQRTPEENVTASAVNTTENLHLTSAVLTGVSSNGVNSSEMRNQESAYTTLVRAPTTVSQVEASSSLGLTSSPEASLYSSSVSHTETAASTHEASSSLLPIVVSVANASDVILSTSLSSPASGDLTFSFASETTVTAEDRSAATEANTSTATTASHTDAILTTANVSTKLLVSVHNNASGEDQQMSTSSVISATYPVTANGSNATILSQSDSTMWLTSTDQSPALTTGLNQTTTTSAADFVAGASSSASTSEREQSSSFNDSDDTATTIVTLSAVNSSATTSLVNDSSATSTEVMLFMSTPTPLTASQSVNSNETTRSTINNIVTTASYSTEGTSASVADHVSSRPIKPNFTVEQDERKYGAVVQLTTNMSTDQFDSLRTSLRQKLTDLTNSKCNSEPIFPTCCRNSGSRLRGDRWRVYVQTEEVYLGRPQNPLAGQLWFVVVVAPEASNSLCTDGGSSSGGGSTSNPSRNKRDVKFLSENILDPIFLTLILSNATSDIEQILGNLTNTTVVVNLIDRAEVIVRQLEESAAGGAAVTTSRTSTFVVGEGLPSLIAWALPVTFITAAAILVIAIVVAFRRKRCGSVEMHKDLAFKDARYSYELQVTP